MSAYSSDKENKAPSVSNTQTIKKQYKAMPVLHYLIAVKLMDSLLHGEKHLGRHMERKKIIKRCLKKSAKRSMKI